MEYMPYVWLGLAVVLMIVEVMTVQMVSIWFVAGAVVTAICSATFLKEQLILQIILFLLVSAVALIITKPLTKKLKSGKTAHTNSDRNIGKSAVVITKIDPATGTGMVSVGKEKWSAKTPDNTVIEEGANVTVLKIEGVKLIVEKQNER